MGLRQDRVFPQYLAALERIEEYSHLWVLTWLHQAPRNAGAVVPMKVNPLAKQYGVSPSAPVRPNPIALTLVQLERVAGNTLDVRC